MHKTACIARVVKYSADLLVALTLNSDSVEGVSNTFHELQQTSNLVR